MQPETRAAWRSLIVRGAACLGILVFAALVLTAMGATALREGLTVTMFGWWGYVARVGPRITVSTAGVATGLICAVVFTAGLHGLLRWLFREVRAGSPPWKLRWTLSIVGIIVLMFAAGIAIVGVVHQTGWLIASKRPLVESRPDAKYYATNFHFNLQQIALGVHNYSSSHAYGTLPPFSTSPGHFSQSWQSAILGFLPFHLVPFDSRHAWDEPPNSAHYRGLIPLYLNADVPAIRDSRGYALSHIGGNVHIFGRPEPLQLDESSTGMSHTMMAAEVAAGFKSWGDPTNLRDPSRPFDGSIEAFGSPRGDGVTVLMMDGSVKVITARADPRVLRALAGSNNKRGQRFVGTAR
jgi:hypothetical protein